MANSQNDIDIYYAVGNANTKRQENENKKWSRLEVNFNKHSSCRY